MNKSNIFKNHGFFITVFSFSKNLVLSFSLVICHSKDKIKQTVHMIKKDA